MGYTIVDPGKELPITMQPETMDLQRNEHVFKGYGQYMISLTRHSLISLLTLHAARFINHLVSNLTFYICNIKTHQFMLLSVQTMASRPYNNHFNDNPRSPSSLHILFYSSSYIESKQALILLSPNPIG